MSRSANQLPYSYLLQDNIIKNYGEKLNPENLTIPYDEWRQEISTENIRINELLQLEKTITSDYRSGISKADFEKYSALKAEVGSYKAILEIQRLREN